VWAGHPWVYAQAVEHIEGGATPGDEVDVVDPRGQFLGRGLYSPGTAIVVRLYTRSKSQSIDQSLVEQRLKSALVRRQMLGLPSVRTNAFRWVNGEGDDFPGLVIDRYADTTVVQLTTIGVKRREAIIFDAIEHLLRPRCIIDRTSAKVAEIEKIEPGRGLVRGLSASSDLVFRERAFEFVIPQELSQKTGYYLDQRTLRGRVEQMSKGRRVLDVFSYVGPFSLAAARGGALAVTAVDSSLVVLEVAAQLAARNGLTDRIVHEHSDAFDALKRVGRSGGCDIVVCDPPKLAPSRAAGDRAHTYMRRIAAAGCQAVSPGGLLILCSCSAALGLKELTRALALGGRDVNVVPRVIERWYQGPDHPVIAAFPEGLYLSAVIAEISGMN
jgi:23S rRNA (cytosine1962-C5)-methyltransferase